jgi:hypothetical protein
MLSDTQYILSQFEHNEIKLDYSIRLKKVEKFLCDFFSLFVIDQLAIQNLGLSARLPNKEQRCQATLNKRYNFYSFKDFRHGRGWKQAISISKRMVSVFEIAISISKIIVSHF